jgi:anti-anti-sigma factor
LRLGYDVGNVHPDSRERTMQEHQELTIDVDAAADVATVRCHGRLTLTSATDLRNTVKPLFPNRRTVSIDLTDVKLMDSVGLGTIVSLYVSARNVDCQLLVINISPRIRELFSVTRVLSLFEPCGEANIRLP